MKITQFEKLPIIITTIGNQYVNFSPNTGTTSILPNTPANAACFVSLASKTKNDSFYKIKY